MKKRKKNPVQIIFFLKGETGKVTMNYACYLMGLEGVGEILDRFPSIDLKLRNRIYEEYQVLFGGVQEEKTPAELASAITPVAEEQTELPLEEALVSIQNDQVVVSSRQIAAHFGKQHKDVLKAISNLECTPEFNQRNFAPVTFMDKKGEQRPEYLITYEGFSFLVMGFTGKNAAMWKERYIEAFTKMKAQQNEQKQAPVFEIPQTYADALLLAANQAKTIEEQTAQLKEALVSVANERIVVSSRQIAAHFDKEHRNVLQVIENLIAENQALTDMFFESSYKAGTGKSYKEYLITYEGFMLTAMGFTGKKAIDWKLKYIQAFKEMKEQLDKQKQAPVFDIPQTYADALLLAANQAKTIEEQTAQLKEALVSVQNDRAVVSSRQIAAHFGKEHKNVLQSIQNLECSLEFGRLSFEPSSYRAASGKENPEYLITRDGFSFLAMGFTGKDAATWKERYINAFNEMEAKLKEKQAPAAA